MEKNNTQKVVNRLSEIGVPDTGEFSTILIQRNIDDTATVEEVNQFDNISEQIEDKIRTPSGNLKPNSVKEITNYFAKKNSNVVVRSEKATTQPLRKTSHPKIGAHKVKRNIARKLKHKAKLLVANTSVHSGHASLKVKKNNLQSDKHQSADNYHSCASEDSTASGLSSSDESEGYFTPTSKDHSTVSEEELFQALAAQARKSQMEQSRLEEGDNQQVQDRSAASIKSPDQAHNQTVHLTVHESSPMETNESENPAVMSIASVVSMFNKLRSDVNCGVATLAKEVNELKEKQKVEVSEIVIESCKKEITESLDVALVKDRDNISTLQKDLRHFKFRNRTLTNVVQSMSVEMADLRQRLENVEVSTCRNAITLSGMYLNGKKWEDAARLEQFIQTNVGVNVAIEDFFRMGANEPKLTVIYLQNAQQKRDVLHFKSYLKDIANEDGKPMYISDYIPASVIEKRKRDKDIFATNDALENPLEIGYTRGRLVIAGSPFKQRVETPSPADLVDISADELNRILKLNLTHGGKVSQDNSDFTGYTAVVDNHKNIRDLYVKVKLMEPSARHIVCAYWIRGDTFYNQDSCDDGEPSAGRTILNFLLKHKFENRVVFVARKYGGVRMGVNRFECYKEAAKLALHAQPWNDILKVHQSITDQTHIKLLDNPVQNQQSSEQEHNPARQGKRQASSPPDRAVRGMTKNKRPYGRFPAQASQNPTSGWSSRGRITQQQRQLNNIRGTYRPQRARGAAGYSSRRNTAHEQSYNNHYHRYDRGRAEDWSEYDRGGFDTDEMSVQ